MTEPSKTSRNKDLAPAFGILLGAILGSLPWIVLVICLLWSCGCATTLGYFLPNGKDMAACDIYPTWCPLHPGPPCGECGHGRERSGDDE